MQSGGGEKRKARETLSLPPSVCFAPAVYVDTLPPWRVLGFAYFSLNLLTSAQLQYVGLRLLKLSPNQGLL